MSDNVLRMFYLPKKINFDELDVNFLTVREMRVIDEILKHTSV